MLRLVLDVFDRLRQPRSRADEIVAVRRQLAAAVREARHASPREHALARELTRLREAMRAALEGARACAGCERPCGETPSARRGRGNGYRGGPPGAHVSADGRAARIASVARERSDASNDPTSDATSNARFTPWRGRAPSGFAGGACCAAQTSGIFDDDELYALALAGTRPSDLQAPPGDHAGCAFRDASGCTLRPLDRPTICARYLCHELQTELQTQGRRLAARAIGHDLRRVFEALVAARRTRVADAVFEPALGLRRGRDHTGPC